MTRSDRDDGDAAETDRGRPGILARILLAALRAYQLVSPLLRPRCRFLPTCSQYAVEAVVRYGAARGAWLALRRLLRCHPFHPGGHDPVPPPRSHRRTTGPAAVVADPPSGASRC